MTYPINDTVVPAPATDEWRSVVQPGVDGGRIIQFGNQFVTALRDSLGPRGHGAGVLESLRTALAPLTVADDAPSFVVVNEDWLNRALLDPTTIQDEQRPSIPTVPDVATPGEKDQEIARLQRKLDENNNRIAELEAQAHGVQNDTDGIVISFDARSARELREALQDMYDQADRLALGTAKVLTVGALLDQLTSELHVEELAEAEREAKSRFEPDDPRFEGFVVGYMQRGEQTNG